MCGPGSSDGLNYWSACITQPWGQDSLGQGQGSMEDKLHSPHLHGARKTMTSRESKETTRCWTQAAVVRAVQEGHTASCAQDAQGRGRGASKDAGFRTAGCSLSEVPMKRLAAPPKHLPKYHVQTNNCAFRAARFVRETRVEAAILTAGQPIQPTCDTSETGLYLWSFSPPPLLSLLSYMLRAGDGGDLIH